MAPIASGTASLIVALVFISVVHCQLYRGEDCTHKNEAGICKHIQDCPSALQGIKKGISPTTCSFEEFAPIVCCPFNTEPQSSQNKKIAVPGAKAAQMCEEYSKYVHKYERPPILLPGAKAIKIDRCFQSPSFIVGGEKAVAMEFPHMALVGFGDKDDIAWGCGGSLISPRFVLTAGHCVSSKFRGAARWVRVGDLNIAEMTDNARPQEVAVINRIVHPDYKPPASYHDIALLELERDLELNEFVRPACLHTSLKIQHKAGIATGWGLTNSNKSEGSDDLLKVALTIQRTATCNTAYKPYFRFVKLNQGIREDIMICAGEMKGGKDTCRGDSGGPLQLAMHKPYCMYDIIGITSFGNRFCGAKNFPAVYTRVSHYVPWIEKIVWP